MARVHNFNAGPAALPLEVLEQVREELLDWHGSGMSIMEMSHRGKEFIAVAEQAEQDLRDLLQIPANYKVLFLQGGATQQFSMVPMNLLRGKRKADYVNTGAWSKKAIGEAKRYCEVNLAPAVRAATSPPSRRWHNGSLIRRPPICITRPTKPSAASNSTGCRRPARCRWWVIFRPPSCRGRWTSAVRADLCRRAEEHRPGWIDPGDRA